jgi:polysaccharide export outer membrane protein
MFRTFSFITLLFLGLLSCNSTNKIVYFQHLSESSQVNPDYRSVLKPDDQLLIFIGGADAESLTPFQFMQSVNSNGGVTTQNQGTQNNIAYPIDLDGNIYFPVLGKVRVAGITRMEAALLLQERLSEYVKDVVVNVQMQNNKYTILGQVSSTGVFSITTDRFTLIDALAKAGDLKPTAKRTNITVLREENGIRKKYLVDLTQPTVFNSPVYYIKQNDIIYVEPNAVGKIQGSNTFLIAQIAGSSLSVILSIFTLISLSK